jgi:hypothetical protein
MNKTFKQKKSTKVLSAVVGVVTGFSMIATASAAGLTQAQVDSILQFLASFNLDQATINDVQAALTGQPTSGGSTGGTTTGGTCTPYVFSKNLQVGDTGADVMNLQKVLNMDPATQVATVGAGSPGSESTYFGSLTKAAVIKFQDKYAADVLTPLNLTKGTGYVGASTRTKLNAVATCTSTGTGTGTGTTGSSTTATGPVTVALAATSPTQGGLLEGQAGATLAEFQFTGVGSVSSVTLKRLGFSDQNAMSAVYLYDGATRLTDGYTFNSNGDLVINGLTIAVNGTKVITVKGDVESVGGALLSTESNIAVALTSYIANSVATATNVQGAYLTFVAGSLAGVSFGAANTATGTPQVDAGTSNYTVWGQSLNVSTRAVTLKGATFKMIGSAPVTSLSDVALYVDGVQAGSATAVTADGTIAFDLSAAPVALGTGSHTVEVRANIAGGASRSFYVSLRQASDIVLIDSTYGSGITVSNYTTGGSAYYNGAEILIKQGSLSLTKDTEFDTSNSLTSGASNQTIGKYKLQAYGEDVKIMQLQVDTVMVPATGLQNVGLYVNGAQVGSNQNLASGATTTTFNLGSQLIVSAGTTVTLEVRADLNNAAGTAYTGTIATDVSIPSNQAQGMTSYTLTTVSSPGTFTVTVSTASAVLAASTSYTDQTLPANSSSQKIGEYVFEAGATEGLRVTNLNVAFDATIAPTSSSTAGSIEATDIANLTLSLDGGASFLASVNPSLSSNNFSVDFTVPANTQKTVGVYADITSATNGEKIKTSLIATARGASSNTALTGSGFSSAVTGQTITVGSGSLATLTIVTNSDTNAQYVVGPASNRNIIRYNATATGGPITIQEMTFDIGTSTTGAITGLSVASDQGSAAVCPAKNVVGTTVTITGCNIPVPLGYGGANLYVQANYGTVGYNGIASNALAAVHLTSVKYTTGGTATTDTTIAGAAATSSTMHLVASMPTITLASSGATLAAGEVKMGTVTITAGTGGSVKLNTLPVNVVLSSTLGYVSGSSTVNAIVLREGNTTINTTDNLTTDAKTQAGVVTFTDTTIISAGESKTYDIYVVYGGTIASGDSAQISLSPASSFSWDDVAGNGTGLAGTLINAYPTNTVSASN